MRPSIRVKLDNFQISVGESHARILLPEMQARNARLKLVGIGVLCVTIIGLYLLRSRESIASSALKQMSSEERWSLDYLFREILLRQEGSYVLYGHKPVAWGGICLARTISVKSILLALLSALLAT